VTGTLVLGLVVYCILNWDLVMEIEVEEIFARIYYVFEVGILILKGGSV
jgi:hypothetical protein